MNITYLNIVKKFFEFLWREACLRLSKKPWRPVQLTYLIISHDLAVIEHVSDYIGVMYLGKLVELAPRDHIYENPLNPYTRALLDSVPIADPNIIKDVGLEGEVPSPLNPPAGCRFHSRCGYRMKECDQIEPEFIDRGDKHFVACHLN